MEKFNQMNNDGENEMRFNIKFLSMLLITAFLFFGCGEKKNEEAKKKAKRTERKKLFFPTKRLKKWNRDTNH